MAGDIAILSTNLTGGQNVNLNQAITVGQINIGDTGAAYYPYTIAPNGGSLTFDNSGAGARINLLAGPTSAAVANVISAPITLADDLTILAAPTSYNFMTISGVISGTKSLTINVNSNNYTNTSGTFMVLQGVNTLSGATNLTSGKLLLSGAGSLANSDLTIGGAYTTASTLLVVTPTVAGTTQRTKSLTFSGSNYAYDTYTGPSITVNGVAAGQTIENFGALTLNAGMVRTNFKQNAASNLQILFSDATRNSGSILDYRGAVQAGTATIASATANTVNVVFTSAPTLTGGGGADGSDTISILPWAFVNGNLTTYNSTYGLRALNTTTEMVALSGSITSAQNAKFSSSVTLASSVAANSLYLGGADTSTITLGNGLAGNTTSLAIGSGAIAAGVGGATIGAVANNGELAFGATDAKIFVTGSKKLLINSVITGSGGLTVALDAETNNSSQILALNGANTFTGLTRVTGNNVLGWSTLRLLNSAALQNSTLDYNNYGALLQFGSTLNGIIPATNLTAATFGGLQGAQNLALTNSGGGGGGVALTVGGNNESTTYSGVLSGTGSVTKAGSGTLTLSNANTYTGATAVNAGTLLISGTGSINTSTGAIAISAAGASLRYDSSAALTRDVTVTSGGTFVYNSSGNYSGAFTQANGKLGGTNWNGTLSGLTIGTSQTISPGNSPGTASTGSQTWAGGGSYLWEINNATGTAGVDQGWDLISGTGSLSITADSGTPFSILITSLTTGNVAGTLLNFNGLSTSYQWKIADFSTAITLDPTAFALDTTAFTPYNTVQPSGTWSIKLGNSPGITGGDNTQLWIVYTVPEPSTVVLLLAGTAAMAGLGLRRRPGRTE